MTTVEIRLLAIGSLLLLGIAVMILARVGYGIAARFAAGRAVGAGERAPRPGIPETGAAPSRRVLSREALSRPGC
jgi:hypothetical protein